MKSSLSQELLTKYKAGTLTVEEEQLLEQHIEDGWIGLEDLEDLQALHEQIGRLVQQDSSPSRQLSSRFHDNVNQWHMPSHTRIKHLRWYQVAAAVVILLVGIGLGSIIQSGSENHEQLQTLSSELSDMRELLTLSLLEQSSPSERMKAVFLTQEMPKVSESVGSALLHTLSNDPNVNVRLVTLEVLYTYADDPLIREGLIKAIPHQDSPLVQLAIADAMVALQERASVQALEGLLKQELTPEEVKDQLRKSIQTLM